MGRGVCNGIEDLLVYRRINSAFGGSGAVKTVRSIPGIIYVPYIC